MARTDCEMCGNYVYDEEYECYECKVYLDEDEMAIFFSDTFYECPYYKTYVEYKIVR